MYRSAAALLLVAANVHAQTVLYVDDDAPPNGDGLSWRTAFNDLHDALAVVNDSIEPHEVRIAQGLYLPDMDTGDAQLRYQINSAAIVSIRGAFAGLSGDDPDEQDFVKYTTRLSGDLMQNDDGSPESREDNAVTVLDYDGLLHDEAPGMIEGLRIESAGNAACRIDRGDVVVSHCVFLDNGSSGLGGGLRLHYTRATVLNCRFEGNRAVGGAGAYIDNCPISRFEDCEFLGNVAWSGGAATVSHGDPEFRRCRFEGNIATARGGACFFNSNSMPTLRVLDSVFLANHTVDGPGSAIYSLAVTEIYGSTFTLNTCLDSIEPPVKIGDGAVIGASCVFWLNDLKPEGAFTYSLGVFGGEGNISVDPLFADLAAGDLRLRPYSPAIDAGSNNGVFSDVDIAGLPRRSDDPAVADTGFGDAPIVDMGAYEFQGSSCAADFNADGELNVLDFIAFQIAFTANDPTADCNADDAFTILDFVCFQQAFVAGCP